MRAAAGARSSLALAVALTLTFTLILAAGTAAVAAEPSRAVTTPASAAAPPAVPGPSAAASAPQEDLDRARAELARLQQLAASPNPPPLAEELARLQARLVLLLASGRESRPAVAAPPEADAEADAQLTALQGASPPVPVAMLDAVRDRRDGVAEQRAVLAHALRGLDAQIEMLMTARRRADEARRLADERALRARGEDDAARLRAEAELARLEARVAAQELLRADRDRTRTRERLAAVQARLAVVDQAVERARPLQAIDDAAIAAIAAQAQAERRRIATQRQQLGRRLQALPTVAVASAPPEAAAAADEAAWARREAAALGSQLAALAEQDQIEIGRPDIWRQRRALLEAITDPGAREPAVAVARRSVEQIDQRLQVSGEQLAVARAAQRALRLQAEALAADPRAARRLAALEAAMQAEVQTLEAVDTALRRLQGLLQRSLDDLAAVTGATRTPWPERAWTWLRGAAVTAWRHELFSVSETTTVDGRAVTQAYGVTVGKAVGVALLFVLGWWVARRLTRWAIALMVRRAGLSEQLGRVLGRWVMAILGLVVLLVVLKLARIPLTAFAFLGGALAIGVGFGTQNVIKNLISGVIILFERKVRVGDIVTVDGVSGTVTSVDLRATTVRGFDGIEAIVPNSQLLENRVSNWSLGNPVVRRSIAVGIAYGCDARAAADAVLACAKADPAVLADPAPEVLFDDFGADAQVLRLLHWVRLGGPRAGPTVDSDLRHAISAALARGGFTIAFPQRDVHLDLDLRGPLPVELRGRAA